MKEAITIRKKFQDLIKTLLIIFAIIFLGMLIIGALATSVQQMTESIFLKKFPVTWGNTKLTETTLFGIEIGLMTIIALMIVPFYFTEKIKMDGEKLFYYKFFQKPQTIAISEIHEVRYEVTVNFYGNYIVSTRHDLILQSENNALAINSIVTFPEKKVKELLDYLKTKNKNITFIDCEKMYSKKLNDYLPFK